VGQQQLLLIVLGVIIAGIAVVVGINLFNANSRTATLDTLTHQLISYGQLALEYYKKPKAYGGGGHSFEGWIFPNSRTDLESKMISPANGSCSTQTVWFDYNIDEDSQTMGIYGLPTDYGSNNDGSIAAAVFLSASGMRIVNMSNKEGIWTVVDLH